MSTQGNAVRRIAHTPIDGSDTRSTAAEPTRNTANGTQPIAPTHAATEKQPPNEKPQQQQSMRRQPRQEPLLGVVISSQPLARKNAQNSASITTAGHNRSGRGAGVAPFPTVGSVAGAFSTSESVAMTESPRTLETRLKRSGANGQICRNPANFTRSRDSLDSSGQGPFPRQITPAVRRMAAAFSAKHSVLPFVVVRCQSRSSVPVSGRRLPIPLETPPRRPPCHLPITLVAVRLLPPPKASIAATSSKRPASPSPLPAPSARPCSRSAPRPPSHKHRRHRPPAPTSCRRWAMPSTPSNPTSTRRRWKSTTTNITRPTSTISTSRSRAPTSAISRSNSSSPISTRCRKRFAPRSRTTAAATPTTASSGSS